MEAKKVLTKRKEFELRKPKGISFQEWKKASTFILEEYPVNKKAVFYCSQMPVGLGDYMLIYEKSHVKLFLGQELVKEFSCRMGDKVVWDGKRLFRINAPKLGWKKYLWGVNLTKGNFRHPNMIAKEGKFAPEKTTIVKFKDDEKGGIIAWRLNNGFVYWYAYAKSYSEEELTLLAKHMSDLIGLDDKIEDIVLEVER